MRYYISIEQPGVDWEDTPQMSFTIDSMSPSHIDVNTIAMIISEMHKSTVRLSKSAGYNNQGYYYNSEWK